MDTVDLRLVLRRNRRHDAIADCSGVAVMWLHQGDARAAAWRAPRDHAFVFHEAPDPALLGDRIVELRGTREIVRAERHVTNHRSPPSRLIEACFYAALRFG